MRSYEASRLALLSQEQTDIRQSLGEMRQALNAMLRRLEAIEQQQATQAAAWESHVTATPVPVFEGE